jgi:peroxiredoxin
VQHLLRAFNAKADDLKYKSLCISRDLPFAQNVFCRREGFEKCRGIYQILILVILEKNYGLELSEEVHFAGLHILECGV